MFSEYFLFQGKAKKKRKPLDLIDVKLWKS